MASKGVLDALHELNTDYESDGENRQRRILDEILYQMRRDVIDRSDSVKRGYRFPVILTDIKPSKRAAKKSYLHTDVEMFQPRSLLGEPVVNPRIELRRQIASLTLARKNPLTVSAGTTIGAPTELFSLAATRVGRPSISTFCNSSASD